MGAFENQSGKVSETIFKEDLLRHCGAIRPEVLCGPSFGVDTAIVDIGGEEALAISSDPLSLIPSLGMEVSAWLSVHLLVNDMCTTGHTPQYAQFVLNLPVSLSRASFGEYWQHIHTLCKNLNIAITGGHTGQIPGQESTISGGGTMFLKAPKHTLLSSNNAKAGDSIIATKHAAISSTSLLSRAFPETVKKELGDDIQQLAADNFWKLSVREEALLAAETLVPNKELHAMHDVTEGGILGAVNEMADASHLGFQIQKHRLPISDEIEQVAGLFKIDPYLSVGAGSMLMAVQPGFEEKLLSTLSEKGIPAVKIGTFTSQPDKLVFDHEGHSTPFQFDGTDPYWEAFFHALQSGWT